MERANKEKLVAILSPHGSLVRNNIASLLFLVFLVHSYINDFADDLQTFFFFTLIIFHQSGLQMTLWPFLSPGDASTPFLPPSFPDSRLIYLLVRSAKIPNLCFVQLAITHKKDTSKQYDGNVKWRRRVDGGNTHIRSSYNRIQTILHAFLSSFYCLHNRRYRGLLLGDSCAKREAQFLIYLSLPLHVALWTTSSNKQ